VKARFPFVVAGFLSLLLLPACPERERADDDTGGGDYEGDEPGECDDGADNDQDGWYDCDDQDCANSPDCQGGDDDAADDDASADDDDTAGDDDTADDDTDDDDTADDDEVVSGAYIYANTSQALYAIDPVTYDATLIGNFSGLNALSQGVTDIAVDQLGNMYAVGFFEIYRVDVNNAALTELNFFFDFSEMNAMTFLADGTLLAGGGGSFWEIDPTGGERTALGSFPGGWIYAGDMVGLPDGLLYNLMSDTGEEADPTSLVVLDMDSGDASEVGATGQGAMYGVAYYNTNGQIYGFAEGGTITLVDPGTGWATVVDNSGIPWWGATTNPARWSD
jgi:hypothetical protein